MPKAYTSHKDAKKLAKSLSKGDKVYALWAVATSLAPYEDDFLYSEYTVTGQHPLVGGAMLGGAMSVERLVDMCEGVYLEPPEGYRNLGDPSPQVAAPDPDVRKRVKQEHRRLRKLAGV